MRDLGGALLCLCGVSAILFEDRQSDSALRNRTLSHSAAVVIALGGVLSASIGGTDLLPLNAMLGLML